MNITTDTAAKLTLAGVVVDAKSDQPLANISVALAKGNGSSAHDDEIVTTDASGAWSFQVHKGDYVVRMPRNGVQPPVGSVEWIYCGQSFQHFDSSKTDVVFEADAYPVIQRTPELDSRYIASVIATVKGHFEEQTKNATTLEEVKQAALEAEATISMALAQLEGGIIDFKHNLKLYVACSSCRTRCYGSSDPNCLSNCYYSPVPCY